MRTLELQRVGHINLPLLDPDLNQRELTKVYYSLALKSSYVFFFSFYDDTGRNTL